MKYPFLLILTSLLALLSGCNDRRPGDPTVENTAPEIVAPDTADNRGVFAEEREQYRYRISRRLNELEGEIEEARKRRQAEKNRMKSKEYNTRIEERERRRKTFEERLAQLEKQTEEGWQNFKAELEDLFNRDKGNDSIRMIK